MSAAFIRPDMARRSSRRYLSLALESVKTLSVRPRVTVRMTSTDGPFAETKEKASAGP